MNLTPRYWRRKWCRVWRVWHLDIDDESNVEFEEPDTSILIKLYITFVINIEVSVSSNSTSLSSSISRCQPLQILHHFRHQYRGVRFIKLYITFVINIEVSGSSNSTWLSSKSLTPGYWWRNWCRVWWTWHLDIEDERDVEIEESDTSILMTKVM
jgi:hypothetical protein